MSRLNYNIKKRCPNCGKLFKLPYVRKSKAMDNIIRYYPCPHCGYVGVVLFNEKKKRRKWKKLKGCMRCKVPFSVEPHHSRGMCKRCTALYYKSDNYIKNKTLNAIKK